MARILIAGGYGMVGSTTARHVRTMSRDVGLILVGRSPDKGAALARELGGTTARLDLADPASVAALPAVDLIVSALYDPANALVHAALARGMAHIGIATKADDLAPIVAAALRSPPRPIVLLGHCAAGAVMPVACKAAEEFDRVDRIEIAALHDERDPVGPMTAGDVEMLVSRALLREDGTWKWVAGPEHPRMVRIADDIELGSYPACVLDAPSLAAITGAPNVRLDLMAGDSIGTREGGRASCDVYVDIEGVVKSGARVKRRVVMSDPNGLAHLTALGAAIAIERVLGLDGRPAASGGLHLPETLLAPDAAIARLQGFGVRITEQA